MNFRFANFFLMKAGKLPINSVTSLDEGGEKISRPLTNYILAITERKAF